jgi:barstar (barnase inhibitor)
MNGQEPLFTPDRSGVYAVGDTARLEALAQKAHLAWYRVDLVQATDKQRLLSALAEGLALPRDFGANWDALADYVQDLSWAPAAGHVVAIHHAAACAAATPDNWTIALDILRDAAIYWRGQGRIFIVLIHGSTSLPAFPA